METNPSRSKTKATINPHGAAEFSCEALAAFPPSCFIRTSNANKSVPFYESVLEREELSAVQKNTRRMILKFENDPPLP